MRDKHNFSVRFLMIGKHYILGVVNGKFETTRLTFLFASLSLLFFLKCETKTETLFICRQAARFCHLLVISMALKNIEANA